MNNLRIVALAVIALLSVNCSAAPTCSEPVHLIEMGAPADCRGYLMSPEKEQEVRLKVQDYDLLKGEVDVLNKSIQNFKSKEEDYDTLVRLETEKAETWRTKAEDATEKLTKADDKKLLYILEGIGLTVLGAWALGQVNHR